MTVKRIGHKGADLIAPGNTLASFDAALAAGVDMIEFDVLPDLGPDGRPDTARGSLLLAHDYGDLHAREPLGLGDGLAHLAAPPFDGIELDVDLKIPGYELRVVDALRAHGLVERSLISSTYPESLARIRAYEPRLRLGWSVPRARRDYTASALYKLPAYAAVQVISRRLPGRAAQALRARRCDALMVHWRLVTPRLVREVDAAGGELYVWTVDEAPRIRALAALGVTGVITNDPRLFTAPA
ncbi:glycerophosphoryl diester phosphodiesterase [Conexibacter woesei DSM 14684]|uniref:Glycerophosphoryl diester phosphodiesterase n=2 Tax=Conexibacter TaxID=191494 RepID=D3F2S5_CONWI|nr:glycerophosphoryl diester phosphodiesterase [Conexibacter woesei DSM 14684]